MTRTWDKALYAFVLLLIFVAVLMREYDFAKAMAAGGIYAELWNIRTGYLVPRSTVVAPVIKDGE